MLTKLPEIAQRLANFYGNKYGPENLVIIKDSKQVCVMCIHLCSLTNKQTKVIQWLHMHMHTHLNTLLTIRMI